MPIQFIKKQLSSESVKNVMVLFSGSAVAQAIPVLSMIVLTRIYPEDVFGIFFIYSSSNLILAIIATLKFQLAIVLPKDDESAFHLLQFSILLSFLMAVVTFSVIYFLHDFIVSLLKDRRIGGWLYFLPISLFLTGTIESTNYWFNRTKQFKKISESRIIKSTGLSITQITLGVFKYTSIGLITGLLAGQFIAALTNITRVIYVEKGRFSLVSFKKIKNLVKTYRKIPLFNTLIGLINNVSNQLPVFLLSNFYGVVITGYYGLANRVVQTPMGLIGNSVGQVFFQKASSMFNEQGNIFAFVRKTYLQLLKVGVLPFALLFIFAPVVFKIVFGSEWESAGKYAQILVPWLFLAFMNAPVSFIVTVLSKQHALTVYEVLLLIARFGALFIGYRLWSDVVYTIVLFSAVGWVFNFFLVFYYLHISKTTTKPPVS